MDIESSSVSRRNYLSVAVHQNSDKSCLSNLLKLSASVDP
jgi:hypothetical protein